MTSKEPVNEEASRAFMDALTASDDAHREAMRKIADLRDNEADTK